MVRGDECGNGDEVGSLVAHKRLAYLFLPFTCLFLFTLFSLLSYATSEWQETVLVSDPADQVNPAISGHTVVWQDYRNKSSGCATADNCLPADVFIKEIPAGSEQKLTATANALDPDVSGNRVVWRNWDTGKIIVHEISTGGEQNASSVGGTVQQVQPAISGDRVVWIDYRHSTDYGDVYMRDLTAPTDQPVSIADPSIPTYKKDKKNPDIDGNIVVWEDWRNATQDELGWVHNPDIYMKDLSTGVEQPVCTDLADQYSPAVEGNKIVWQDYRNGNWDIYMREYDPSTGLLGAETRVTNSNDDQTWPAISGDFIAWKSKPRYVGHEDIYLRKLSSGTEIAVTSDAASQKLPVLSGPSLVWIDNRSGNWDIYNLNDVLAPQFSSVNPAGFLTTTSTTITALYNDGGSGIDLSAVLVSLDGAPLVGCTVQNTRVDCPVSGLSQGLHNFTVNVTDLAGNHAGSSGTFTVDSIAPIVTLEQPGGWNSTGSTVLSASYSDGGSGINPASVTVFLDGNWVSGCNADASLVVCPAVTLSDGHHVIDVSVFDNAGNRGSASGVVDVDTALPIIGPVTVAVVPGTGNVTIDADFVDPQPASGINPASVLVTLDGATVSGCSASATHISCSASGLSYGSHTVLISAADNAGNSATAQDSFQIDDNTAPLITAGGPMGVVPGPDVMVEASYSDAAPSSGINIGSVRVLLDGNQLAGCTVTEASVSCPANDLAESEHSVQVQVSDNTGNTATENWNFTITHGIPLISNLRPAARAVVNNPWPVIAADYFDGDGINVSLVKMFVDSEEVTSEAVVSSGSISYQRPLNRPPLADGKHNVQVVVADLQGNMADQSWWFTVTSPRLMLSVNRVYWASLDNYLERLLTVEYRMSNPGTGACNNGKVAVAYATNGVYAYGPLPVMLGNLSAGAQINYNFLYQVPSGVSRFIAVSYASCWDDGGNLYWFAGPPPLR